ncbi:MAG: spore maturation protein [Melioribacter sp.]|nr:spore maturation protein [Melioribacter sp.]
MLNYIWLTLLALGIITAFTLDIKDLSNDKYKNNHPLNVIINFEDDINKSKTISAEVLITLKEFNSFYKTTIKHDIKQKITLARDNKNSFSVYLKIDETAPKIWKEIAKSSGKDYDITGRLILSKKLDSLNYSANLYLEKVSFLKMKEVTNAIIDYAENAVKIAIGLIGIMALWLGIMKIAEEAGLITLISKLVRPITKFLFPDVPQDHPAIASIIMNISANMLGLGNAATPFGLKAMEELDKLNSNKGVATNAMCTFLAINTAGLTLIPATAIAIRAAAGSSNPAIIIGTSFFGALCATLTGIIAAKTLEKFPFNLEQVIASIRKNYKKIITLVFIIALLIFLSLTELKNILINFDIELIRETIQLISVLAIPLIIFLFVCYGFARKIKIYEVFIEGAKEGFNVAIRIIPYLVAMLIAIGIFRVSGAMDFLIYLLSPLTNLIGFPAEALPMALMRPLSGSASLGIMSEIISVHGPDSFIGILVSTIMGSTETTFYVLALYFGSVNIKRTRHAVAAGVLADIAGILGAFFIVKLIFG